MRKFIIGLSIAASLVGVASVARAIVVAPSGGSAPACVNSCTGSSIAGNDSAFVVTLGAGSISPMTVNFSGSWATAPICVGQARIQTGLTLETVKIDTETTEFFLSYFPLTPGAGDTVSVLCFGR